MTDSLIGSRRRSMTLAPQTSGSANSSPGQDAALNFALLRLANLTGAGLVRVDAEGHAWPLNETAANLLEALGGSYGATAPGALSSALATAAETGTPQLNEVLTSPPVSRHITVAALHSDGIGLVALRDHTEERLLQERLLQSEKMASVGQLVSGVAHELNNPLTGVMGFSQLLLARELDDTVRIQIQTIYGEAERAAKIVQNLLSFARRRRPTKEMADVNALMQRVLELRSYDFTIRNIGLDITLDAHMARVWVDPDQIQQVFFNVIKNAEQAMIDAHGSGKLTVVTAGAEDSVRISISDDGPGIPPEVARRIFDPFFTTKDAGEGTGLGLTICYGIIDEHGGRIWTENLPEAGSVFHIELPIGAGEEREPGTAHGGGAVGVTPSAVSGRRILVVDDEVSIRLLLHDILRLDQHSVALASSGLEAADLVERERFDIIITDMKMPGMDGASFFRQVQERDPAQAERIIFITGDTVSPDTRAFLQRVTNPVLAKPFKIGPLRDAIEAVLGRGAISAAAPSLVESAIHASEPDAQPAKTTPDTHTSS
ncbi:MAG: response regulator [Dehalococcoidia bacterium]|nr:response regulator [Dehalococcoidia bacterium]